MYRLNRLEMENAQVIEEAITNNKLSNGLNLDESCINNLIEKNVLIIKGEQLEFHKHAHLCFHTINCADYTLELSRRIEDFEEKMLLYVKKETIVYVIEKEDYVEIEWIPTIPLAVGGYASFLGECSDMGKVLFRK